MSTSLIAPMYQEIRKQGKLLATATVADIAKNFVLSLSGPEDGPLLEDWLQESNHLLGLNQLFLSKTAVDDIINLYGPLSALSNSKTATKAYTDNEYFFNKIAGSQTALDIVFASLIGRTLIFASDFIQSGWKTATFVDGFASYIRSLPRTIFNDSFYVDIPIDGNLVSDVSLTIRRSSAEDGYFNQHFNAMPSNTNIVNQSNDTSNLDWATSSGAIATTDTLLRLIQGVNYTQHSSIVITRSEVDTPDLGDYSLQVGYDEVGTKAGFFHGLEMTRRV